ncbi:hypothetical protein GLOIN_2v1836766 [Rhizophagus clarus]|nr:hypothetical protein GLOIN_2v1836766 [Rhizophagus clarus]
MILNLSENWEDDYYDYDFFYENLDGSYYITCKLLQPSLIIDILNKEIYGIDFNVNDLKHKHTLTLNQKLNLELSIKQTLPSLQEKILKRDFSSTPIDQILTPQSNELKLFYQPPNDGYIYNVAYKITLQDSHQNDDNDYDYEFFYQISDDIINTKHVTCKILLPSSIINILNKKIYGIDFDITDLKCKHALAWHQKLNLKLNLKQFFLQIPEGIMRSNGNTISSRENIGNNATQTVPVIDIQNFFDNIAFDNIMSSDDHNGTNQFNIRTW